MDSNSVAIREGWLYVNKKFMKHVQGASKVVTVAGKLRPGDNIVIRAKVYNPTAPSCSVKVQYADKYVVVKSWDST